MSTLRRWMIMLCLCLSGGVIYLLPFLREFYYLPMQEALQLTNTQLGVLMSVFGVTAMISYFPGGWLADKMGPKRLITISMISTGLAGGALLDGSPGTLGYRYFFLFISGLCFMGLLAALVLMRKYIKKRTG